MNSYKDYFAEIQSEPILGGITSNSNKADNNGEAVDKDLADIKKGRYTSDTISGSVIPATLKAVCLKKETVHVCHNSSVKPKQSSASQFVFGKVFILHQSSRISEISDKIGFTNFWNVLHILCSASTLSVSSILSRYQ